MAIKKGRQMGTVLAEIRDDHVERYRLAIKVADREGCNTGADLGAGFGYGTWLLAKRLVGGVVGYDIDPEVIPFAEEHWHHPRATRRTIDLLQEEPDPADIFVAFELIEHFHSEPFLTRARDLCRVFVGSVPNQEVVPFGGPSIHPQHVRHYTPQELRDLLEGAGWKNVTIGCQVGKYDAEAVPRWETTAGRTLVFWATSR